MNPPLEKEFEAEILRALQDLPDLAAPPGLLTRTLAALERPTPLYARSWNRWPVTVQIICIVLALAMVTAAGVGWRSWEPGLLAAAFHRLAPAASGLASFWNVLSALARALALAAEHLGQGFMLACLGAAAVACALCAGFGAIFVRLVLARPGRNLL